MKVEPVVLEGDFIRLDPMRVDHIPALWEAGSDPALWQWTNNAVASQSDIERYVRTAMAERDRGSSIPFVTVHKKSKAVVGSTRFGNIDTVSRKCEIGWTWITPVWQQTAVNTEAKLMMLTHAFETWHCIRVEFKTDSNNDRSRSAIARLGATEEGTLRNHMITESGRFRDSVYFSIIDSEWEAVKADLVAKLEGYDGK